MTRKEQKQFVRSLTNSVANAITKAIDAGNLSDEWDGHELRELIADTFDHERTLKRAYGARSARVRTYRRVKANAGRI